LADDTSSAMLHGSPLLIGQQMNAPSSNADSSRSESGSQGGHARTLFVAYGATVLGFFMLVGWGLWRDRFGWVTEIGEAAAAWVGLITVLILVRELRDNDILAARAERLSEVALELQRGHDLWTRSEDARNVVFHQDPSQPGRLSIYNFGQRTATLESIVTETTDGNRLVLASRRTPLQPRGLTPTEIAFDTAQIDYPPVARCGVVFRDSANVLWERMSDGSLAEPSS
jgi:hypothetical protein